MDRREFLAVSFGSFAAPVQIVRSAGSPSRFFTVERRKGRWWLITPEGKSYFSLALNHIDPTPLRNLENGDLWNRKYGNSMERWLKESVARDLRDWSFNGIGWTQEVVTRGATNQRHSRAWIFEEYQWLGLPYFHLLPFADFHQWDVETRHPNFASSEWIEWCDYVAREHCARMKDDPKLVGYFLVDCPTWIHTRPDNQWKGPLFDPKKLDTDTGRKALFELATRYYRTTYEAIRRYDKNHLIFGDRYEASQPIAEEVIRAAMPFVDVFSFQHFATPDKVTANLRRWHEFTGKPVLLADHASIVKHNDGSQSHDGRGYAKMCEALREVSGCVGYHLCGAYLKNAVRRRALKTGDDKPDEDAIRAIRAANEEMQRWVDGESARPS